MEFSECREQPPLHFLYADEGYVWNCKKRQCCIDFYSTEYQIVIVQID